MELGFYSKLKQHIDLTPRQCHVSVGYVYGIVVLVTSHGHAPMRLCAARY